MAAEQTFVVNPDRFARQFSAKELLDYEHAKITMKAPIELTTICGACVCGQHDLCEDSDCACVHLGIFRRLGG